MESRIAAAISKKLANSENNAEDKTMKKECNFRVKADSPLDGNFLSSCVIYQPMVIADNSVVTTIEMSGADFKTRYSNNI